MTIVAHAARLLEHLLDRRDVGALEQITGGGGDQVQDLLRVAVDGADTEEHPRLHVDEADGDALRDGLLHGRDRDIEAHVGIPFETWTMLWQATTCGRPIDGCES